MKIGQNGKWCIFQKIEVENETAGGIILTEKVESQHIGIVMASGKLDPDTRIVVPLGSALPIPFLGAGVYYCADDDVLVTFEE
jgi:hypothetical protein